MLRKDFKVNEQCKHVSGFFECSGEFINLHSMERENYEDIHSFFLFKIGSRSSEIGIFEVFTEFPTFHKGF